MPRKLYVTDEMGLDDALVSVAESGMAEALLWPWIIPNFDDWGRAEASAQRIKGKIFPLFGGVTVQLIEAAIRLFADKGLIDLYTVNGRRYMAVNPETWFRYQSHIHASKRTEDKSRIPGPPDGAFGRGADEAEPSREIARLRETPRDSAEKRASPSPSPSLSVSSLRSETLVAPLAPTCVGPECEEAEGAGQDLPALSVTDMPESEHGPGPEDDEADTYPEDFLAWWDAYPVVGRRRGSKSEAFKLWRKMVRTEATRRKVMRGLEIACTYEDFSDRFAPAAERWLKARKWEPMLELAEAEQKGRASPPPSSLAFDPAADFAADFARTNGHAPRRPT